MNNYYFTFGYSHTDPNTGENLSKKYVKITAENENSARAIMFFIYGKKWAFQYDEKEFQTQPKEYGLTLHQEYS